MDVLPPISLAVVEGPELLEAPFLTLEGLAAVVAGALDAQHEGPARQREEPQRQRAASEFGA
jgi:hypothetical protein